MLPLSMVFDNKYIISTILDMNESYKNTKPKEGSQVLIKLRLLYALPENCTNTIQSQHDIYTLLCWLSWCRVANYINHPQEICEDVFVMIQPQWPEHTFSSLMFHSSLYLMFFFNVEDNSASDKLYNRQKKIGPVSSSSCLEAAHVCRWSCGLSIYFCWEI